MTRFLLSSVAVAALLAACGETPETETEAAGPQVEAGEEAGENGAETAAEAGAEPGDDTAGAEDASESERLYAWFEEQFREEVGRSPMAQTYLGMKSNNDKWDDASPEFRREGYELSRERLAEMRERFDYDALDEGAQLSWRLWEYGAAREEAGWEFRDHGYVFTQRSGPHSGAPAFLINQHRVDTEADAEAYIARLEGLEGYLYQNARNAQSRFDNGVYPPRWTYQAMIETSRNVVSGAPFDDGEDSPLLADFRTKVDALELSEDASADLIARAETAMVEHVRPAYERLIEMFEAQEQEASTEDGVWKLPEGEAYYAYLLENYTTTDMTAEEIHELGLAEVDRIHAEMRAIMSQVGFDGSLQDFFEFMRTDEQFYYDNTPEGRQRYMDEATAMIDAMREALPRVFNTFPEAELVVRRVEEFREASAGKAFYQRPAPNGSRPGVYYANLRDMADMPTYQMEALAYHEGIPGHHMQLAIQQELEDVPSFRRFSGYTA